MLGTKDASATIPVKDMAKAKGFYEGTLGLTPIDNEGDQATVYQSGSTRLLVYASQFAGTNKATAATWGVGDDIEREVQALKAKGVAFEHYDMPDDNSKGRRACLRRHEGRLVQGPGWEHPRAREPVKSHALPLPPSLAITPPRKPDIRDRHRRLLFGW